MFVRRLSIRRIDASGVGHPCPIRWIDSFAMRNFTNDQVFDDTLPAADGLLEAGSASLWIASGPTWKTGSGARAT